jgi:hypothetical protein
MKKERDDLEQKYADKGIEIEASWGDVPKIRKVRPDFPAEVWLDLLDPDGEFLPICCGNISRVRDILTASCRSSRFVDVDDLFEIYTLLSDHGCFDGEEVQEVTGVPKFNPENPDPLTYLRDLWKAVEAEASKFQDCPHDSSALECVRVVAQTCRNISWYELFSKDGDTGRNREFANKMELAKLLPAIHNLWKNIQQLRYEPVDAWAVCNGTEVAANQTGYCLFDKKEIAQEVADQGNKAEEENFAVAEHKPNRDRWTYVVRRVRICFEEGLIFTDDE